jgi:hypothetical protein
MQLTMALQAVDVDIAWAGGLFTSTEVAVDSVIVQENARGKIENVIGAARGANSGNANLAELESKWLKTSAAGEQGRLEAIILDALNYAPAEDCGARLNNAYRWVCRVEHELDERSRPRG